MLLKDTWAMSKEVSVPVIRLDHIYHHKCFLGGSDGKESSCSAGYPDLIPGSGCSPGEGKGYPLRYLLDFPGGSDGKASACNAGGPDSIPRSGRSPGEGNGNPLQYSCLENPMDGGAW